LALLKAFAKSKGWEDFNWHSQGIETLLAKGKRNPAAGIMVAMLSEIARTEVETLRGEFIC
jgi:hypothetical protein